MQNLNQENFWNNLEKQYPLAVTKFKEWMDNYKKEVTWNRLFNTDIVVDSTKGNPKKKNIAESSFVHVNKPALKFHDLPLEMQVGIIFRFVGEVVMGEKDYKEVAFDETIGQVIELFTQVEQLILKRNNS